MKIKWKHKSIILFILGGVCFSFLWFHHHNQVKSGSIDIFKGASIREVADILEKSGIIKDANVFYGYIQIKAFHKEDMQFDKYGSFSIQSGTYQDLVRQLMTAEGAKVATISVTIPGGTSVEDMAAIFERADLFSSEEFLNYANDPDVYFALQTKYDWLPAYKESVYFPLEGFLPAKTYTIELDATPQLVVNKMVKEANLWYEQVQTEIINAGYSFSDLLILSSIVEKEVKSDENRTKLAQLFFNRLEKGMKLESKETAFYGLLERRMVLQEEDRQRETPYNTFQIEGIPIGSIGAPTKKAFLATLLPEGEAFKALYFYERPNGEVLYSETFVEYEKIRIRYESEWATFQ